MVKTGRKESEWEDSQYSFQIISALQNTNPKTLYEISQVIGVDHSSIKKITEKMVGKKILIETKHKKKLTAYTLNHKSIKNLFIEYYLEDYIKTMERETKTSVKNMNIEIKRKINEFSKLKDSEDVDLIIDVYLTKLKQVSEVPTMRMALLKFASFLGQNSIVDEFLIWSSDKGAIKELFQINSLKLSMEEVLKFKEKGK